MVARLQEIKAGTAVVAVPRTEAQRTAVQDDWAEAQRQRHACCMQTCSE